MFKNTKYSQKQNKMLTDSHCQWNHDLLFRLAASVAFNEIMFYTVWLKLSSKLMSPRQTE
jgi:hypothetical protein